VRLALVRVVMFAALTLALSGEGQGRRCVEYDCPTWEEPVWERSSDRQEAGGLSASCALIAIIAAFLGFALGRVTAKQPPTPAAVAAAITTVAAARITEATDHGVPGAVVLLQRLRDRAITAVQALL
jgi:hypothetical protein